jgi:hypothetical protein
MKFLLYDYLDSNEVNRFKKWCDGLEKSQKAKLREKIDKLAMHGDDLHPHMLSDSEVPGIQKLRVQGPVKLRPLLCKGPVNVHDEYTFLLGAKEVGSKWAPTDAPETANQNKKAVAIDAAKRRSKHERISK